MECFTCKEEAQLAVNTTDCRLCVQCYFKHGPNNDDDVLKNDVIYHIYHNRMRATYSTNATACESNYGELAIVKAREYLLSKVDVKLNSIDENLTVQLATERRSSGGKNGRSKAQAIINDIHTALQVLETDIKVIPDNAENVITLNPESLLPFGSSFAY